MNDPAKECPFCAENAEAFTFASSSAVRALVNKAPVLPGHTLIVPSRHVGDMDSLTTDEFGALFAFARRVMKLITIEFSSPEFDWTLQNGEAAGQTVGHLHLHLIPRHKDDLPDPGDWYPRLNDVQRKAKESGFEAARVNLDEDEQRQVARHLRSRWNDAKF